MKAPDKLSFETKTDFSYRCERLVAFDLGFDSLGLLLFLYCSLLRSSAMHSAPPHPPTFALNTQLFFAPVDEFYYRCEKRCSPARQAVITCRRQPEDDDHISNEDMADSRSSSRLSAAHYSMLDARGSLCCVIRGLPVFQSPCYGCRWWTACELWSSLAAWKVSLGSTESSELKRFGLLIRNKENCAALCRQSTSVH